MLNKLLTASWRKRMRSQREKKKQMVIINGFANEIQKPNVHIKCVA